VLSRFHPTQILLFGGFLSSLGSLVYLLKQLQTFAQLQVSIAAIGSYVFFTRGATFLSGIFASQIVDNVSGRKILLWTEILGALCTVAMFFSWKESSSGLGIFIFWASLRAAFTNIHAGSRTKILAIYGQNTRSKISGDILWLNRLTHGVFLFAAVFLWVFDSLTLKEAILLDGASFVINGLLLWKLPEVSLQHLSDENKGFQSLKNLIRFGGYWAWADFLAAFCMAGLVMFMVRVSQDHPENIYLVYAIYGMSVWLSSSVQKRISLKLWFFVSWFLMISGYFAISQSEELVAKNLFFSILCVGYWGVYNVISTRLQLLSPKSLNAGINTARMTIMLAILVSGEFVFGTILTQHTLKAESLFRASATLIAVIILGWSFRRARETSH